MMHLTHWNSRNNSCRRINIILVMLDWILEIIEILNNNIVRQHKSYTKNIIMLSLF